MRTKPDLNLGLGISAVDVQFAEGRWLISARGRGSRNCPGCGLQRAMYGRANIELLRARILDNLDPMPHESRSKPSTGKLHGSNMWIIDSRPLRRALDGYPNGRRQLQRQFMKLKC